MSKANHKLNLNEPISFVSQLNKDNMITYTASILLLWKTEIVKSFFYLNLTSSPMLYFNVEPPTTTIKSQALPLLDLFI